MQAPAKKKTVDSLKRLSGLTKRLHAMVEEDAYCPKVLEIVLAMQGQLKYIQGTVLESHLHTCAQKKLSSKSSAEREKFIEELIKVIGLSKR